MSQFLIKNENVNNEKILIYSDEQDFKHIIKVHRIKLGEKINLLDELANQYLAEVVEINPSFCALKICSKKSFDRANKEFFTLYQCMPKLNKMDLIIEKAIELGIDRIVPVISENVIVQLDEKSKNHKLNRWKEIAISAVKQSENPIIPEILEPMKFSEMIKNRDTKNLNLIGWEKGEQTLQPILAAAKNSKNIQKTKNINLIVGAEGGFSESEINEATRNGWQDFRLKGNILRAETAPIVLISIIKYELGFL